MLICPGCGGRNDPAARACEWCGRPFVLEHRRVPVLWIIATALIAFLVIGALISIVALVSSRRPAAESTATPPSFIQAPTAPELAVAQPDPTAVLTVELTATPELTPTPEPLPDFLQIGNTGGTGAFIRREPRQGAPGIVALRDGLPVRVVGPEEIVEGRSWINVQDRNGNRGWTPREYLVPTTQRF